MQSSSSKHPLLSLVSVGKKTVQDLSDLGINSIEELAKHDAQNLYHNLNKLKGKQDICMLDVFQAAVVQAKDLVQNHHSTLPYEQKLWFTYSKQRKLNNNKLT